VFNLDRIRYIKNSVEQFFLPKYTAYSLEWLLYEFLVDVLKNSPELIDK